MKGLAAIFGACLFAGACTTGAVGDDVPPGDDMTGDRVTCMAELALTGTFTVSDPQPIEIQGCWPIGTWNFTGTVSTNTCTSSPSLVPYAFTGERNLSSPDPDYDWIFTVTAPSNDPAATASVSSGGGGLCSGEVMLYSTDGLSVFNLHPALQTGGAINGLGTYEVHTTDQRPVPN